MKTGLKRRGIFSAIMALVMMMNITITAFAAEPTKAAHSITNEEITSTIDGIINWGKKGEDKILNETYLGTVRSYGGNWFPLGIGRYGHDDDYKAYLNAVTEYINEKYKEIDKLGVSTEWHKLSMLILAAGGDPTNIGQDPQGNSINLIEDGVYNRRGLGAQGVNGLIWGLLAVDSKNYEIPEGALYTRETIISEILKVQCADGGFALWGSTSDPDMTAQAVQALSPYYKSSKKYLVDEDKKIYKTIKQVVDESLDALSKMQNDEGCFLSFGSANVNSAAQVLVALSTMGIDVENDPRFIKNGNTVIDGIMRFKNSDGGFKYTLNGGTNGVATEQVLYSLVSYDRLRNNMRNLYDYRPEIDQSKFVISANGSSYNVAVNKDTHEYNIELPYETKSIKFTNIPKGPYDKSNINEDMDIDVRDGDKIIVEITNRGGSKKEYTLNVILTSEAAVNSLIKDIDNLPENITLENEVSIEEMLSKYNSFSKVDKAKVTNIAKLNSAKKKLDELKAREEEELLKKQKELLVAVANLPEDISLVDKNKVLALLNEINDLKDFEGKDDAVAKLTLAKEKIEAIEKVVKSIDDQIWAKINPMNVTLKDKVTVLGIIAECEKLSEKDRVYIKNYNDVLMAKKTIDFLEKGIIISNTFELIMGTDKAYSFEGKTIEGKNYTMIFNGMDVKAPSDFECTIELSKNKDKIKNIANDAYALTIGKGEIPGKATVEIEVDLKDREYSLFYFDEKTGKVEEVSLVKVIDGKTKFEIDKAGDYFFTQNKEEVNNVPKTGDNSFLIIYGAIAVLSLGALFIIMRRTLSK